jgi:hypothetical protein
MAIDQKLQQFKKNTKIEFVDFSKSRVPSATAAPGKSQGKGQSI